MYSVGETSISLEDILHTIELRKHSVEERLASCRKYYLENRRQFVVDT